LSASEKTALVVLMLETGMTVSDRAIDPLMSDISASKGGDADTTRSKFEEIAAIVKGPKFKLK